MTKLIVQNLRVRKDDKVLVNDISFELAPGELSVMLGPNGAGKTQALHHAIGLEAPESGLVTLDGEDTRYLDAMSRARALTYLPQTRPLAWPLIVRDLVALGRFSHGMHLGKPSRNDTRAIEDAMEACAITHLAGRKANTLSGGELARVHCARAFAGQTRLLIADEPVAALDPHHQFAIMDLFKAYVANGGGALVVLHNIALAAKYADRLIWMKEGEIIASGTPEDTLTANRLLEVYAVKAIVNGRQVIIEGKA